MAAYRCSTCSLDWPANHQGFTACQSCDGPTERINAVDGMTLDEAWPLARSFAFERFYEERGPREVYVDPNDGRDHPRELADAIHRAEEASYAYAIVRAIPTMKREPKRPYSDWRPIPA
jgi:hypothetical protein